MMGFREVMKEVNSAKYCEFVDLYSYHYEGREDESCPNKSIGVCYYHCKKRFCSFHGHGGKCFECEGRYK